MTSARDVATRAAQQHRADANYHRIRSQTVLAAQCEETAILLDRIAQLIDNDQEKS